MSLFTTMLAASAAASLIPAERPITAPGPLAQLQGTMLDAGRGTPLVLIIPGSGPTDRDGNNPLGVTASTYRLLSKDLAARGISSVRIDKRGMFGSKAAVADGNAVTIADYAEDVHSWVASIRKATGAPCIWLLGHSEGGLVALAAAQRPTGICGVVSVAAPGRKLGEIMREQFRANPANAPILEPALSALQSLQAGRRVDPASLPTPLQPIFGAPVQGYLIDLLAQNPAQLAASLKVPLLIVHGETDLQTSDADAKALAAAQPNAKLAYLPGVNHVLKIAPADRAANLATYADASLPIALALVEAVAAFVRRQDRGGR